MAAERATLTTVGPARGRAARGGGGVELVGPSVDPFLCCSTILSIAAPFQHSLHPQPTILITVASFAIPVPLFRPFPFHDPRVPPHRRITHSASTWCPELQLPGVFPLHHLCRRQPPLPSTPPSTFPLRGAAPRPSCLFAGIPIDPKRLTQQFAGHQSPHCHPLITTHPPLRLLPSTISRHSTIHIPHSTHSSHSLHTSTHSTPSPRHDHCSARGQATHLTEHLALANITDKVQPVGPPPVQLRTYLHSC